MFKKYDKFWFLFKKKKFKIAATKYITILLITQVWSYFKFDNLNIL